MTYETLRVQVTQEHINNGQRAHILLCPIALAIKEQYPFIGSVSVCDKFVSVGLKYYSLPQDAQEFVQRFDERKIVSPSIFFLEKE